MYRNTNTKTNSHTETNTLGNTIIYFATITSNLLFILNLSNNCKCKSKHNYTYNKNNYKSILNTSPALVLLSQLSPGPCPHTPCPALPSRVKSHWPQYRTKLNLFIYFNIYFNSFLKKRICITLWNAKCYYCD